MDTKQIFDAACQACGCTAEEALSKNRRRLPVAARKIICYLLRELTDSEAGTVVNRNHATVNYYRRMKDSNLAGDRLLENKLKDTENCLREKNKSP